MKSKLLSSVGLLILVTTMFTACNTAKYIESTTENYTYPICDVVNNYEETDENGDRVTVLVCKMPNGELHEYTVTDAPEGKIEVVCFRTENQDDYNDYEVVGIR